MRDDIEAAQDYISKLYPDFIEKEFDHNTAFFKAKDLVDVKKKCVIIC